LIGGKKKGGGKRNKERKKRETGRGEKEKPTAEELLDDKPREYHFDFADACVHQSLRPHTHMASYTSSLRPHTLVAEGLIH
jgi:hypothetical protein